MSGIGVLEAKSNIYFHRRHFALIESTTKRLSPLLKLMFHLEAEEDDDDGEENKLKQTEHADRR